MTSPSAPGRTVEALQAILAAEHAAVYGYPLIGVRLADPAQVERARNLEAAHRLSRDSLRAQLVVLSVTPVAAEPSYPAGAPVTDPASAQRWAVQVEEQCAAGYRYLLSAASDRQAGPSPASLTSLREQALTGLTTAAENATRWRTLVSPATPTVPFPGL